MRNLLRCSFLVALLCASGCSGPATEAPADDRPTTLRAAIHRDPASLSLLGKMDETTEVLAAQLTEGLLRYDARLELQPRVAESWSWSEDGATLTFELRPEVRWHDGSPVTADDVVFTVEKARDPATENAAYGPLFRDLTSIEAPDERTVRAVYASGRVGPLDAWMVPLIPRHLASGDADLLTGEFAKNPVGCGPFRFVRYVRGEEIVLDANDDYWDGRPSIDRIVFRIYPDKSTAYQALIKGDLDLLNVSGAQWHEAMESPAASRLEGRVHPTMNVWAVVWNQDGSNPFFVDARVRQAMVHALDRELFAESVARGTASPGVTTFHPASAWASPELRARPFDPELADRLLREAGWIDRDGDGIRDRQGEAFRFQLLLPVSSMQLTRQIAEWQQASWREVGVDMQIDSLEWQAFRERRNAGNFNAASFRFTFTPDPDQFYDLYHSAARENGYNFYGLADEEIDSLLDRARQSRDEEERRELYRRLQSRLYELEAITSLFYFDSPLLHDRRLRGIETAPLGYWRVVEGPQRWSWSESGER